MATLNDKLIDVTQDPGVYLLQLGTSTYVGSSSNIRRRLYEHRSKFLSGKGNTKALIDYFCSQNLGLHDVSYSVLLFAEPGENLLELEWEFIEKLKPNLNSHNDPRVSPFALQESRPVLVTRKDGSIVGEYKSANQASLILNIDKPHAYAVANGQRKSVQGYLLKYI